MRYLKDAIGGILSIFNGQNKHLKDLKTGKSLEKMSKTVENYGDMWIKWTFVLYVSDTI